MFSNQINQFVNIEHKLTKTYNISFYTIFATYIKT